MRCCLTANHVQVTQPVVEKLQTELNPHKATGPVNIPTRFLMECAKDISRALPLVFQVSMHHARRLEEIDGYINLQERRPEFSHQLPPILPYICLQQDHEIYPIHSDNAPRSQV